MDRIKCTRVSHTHTDTNKNWRSTFHTDTFFIEATDLTRFDDDWTNARGAIHKEMNRMAINKNISHAQRHRRTHTHKQHKRTHRTFEMARLCTVSLGHMLSMQSLSVLLLLLLLLLVLPSPSLLPPLQWRSLLLMPFKVDHFSRFLCTSTRANSFFFSFVMLAATAKTAKNRNRKIARLRIDCSVFFLLINFMFVSLFLSSLFVVFNVFRWIIENVVHCRRLSTIGIFLLIFGLHLSIVIRQMIVFADSFLVFFIFFIDFTSGKFLSIWFWSIVFSFFPQNEKSDEKWVHFQMNISSHNAKCNGIIENVEGMKWLSTCMCVGFEHVLGECTRFQCRFCNVFRHGIAFWGKFAFNFFSFNETLPKIELTNSCLARMVRATKSNIQTCVCMFNVKCFDSRRRFVQPHAERWMFMYELQFENKGEKSNKSFEASHRILSRLYQVNNAFAISSFALSFHVRIIVCVSLSLAFDPSRRFVFQFFVHYLPKCLLICWRVAKWNTIVPIRKKNHGFESSKNQKYKWKRIKKWRQATRIVKWSFTSTCASHRRHWTFIFFCFQFYFVYKTRRKLA